MRNDRLQTKPIRLMRRVYDSFVTCSFALTCCLAIWSSTTSHGSAFQDANASPEAELVPVSEDDTNETHDEIILIVGAGGSDKYAALFNDWATELAATAKESGATLHWLGVGGEEFANEVSITEPDENQEAKNHLQQVELTLQQAPQSGNTRLWLILIGHGTFDGESARFNLQGPDLTGTQLAQWLNPISRPLIIVNCSSSSAPFMNQLSGDNRVIVTSTRSGAEQNFSRFGSFFASSFQQFEADLDKDEQVSLLEAFIYASKQSEAYYESEKRLATEHALIDDNGDQRGTPADWFDGFRVDEQYLDESQLDETTGSPDGLRAHQIHLLPSRWEAEMAPEQLAMRNQLEQELEELRRRRNELTEDDYLKQIEQRVIVLAKLYADLDGQLKETAISKSDVSESQEDPQVSAPVLNVMPPRPAGKPQLQRLQLPESEVRPPRPLH